MGNRHIHSHLSAIARAVRDSAIVADYIDGLRTRELMKKYRVGADLIIALLKAANVSARRGGKRKWVNRRARPDGAVELLCSRCQAVKPICEFGPRGIMCRNCVNNRLSIWRNKNRPEVNRSIRTWAAEKKRKDPKHRALLAMKNRLVRILATSGKKKSKKSVTEFLGISRNGFVAHIESLMSPGMTWENRSIGVWHIDHIIPCSAFDHSVKRQALDCWHYTNLRPLWGPENLKKYNKMTVDAMIGPKLIAA